MAEKEHTGKAKGSFRTSVFARLRYYFLAGILVTAPIAITIYLTLAFLKFVDEKVSAIIPVEYYLPTAVPGLGVIIAVFFFIFMGWLARNYLGQILIRISEYFVDKMPVIRTVYGWIKQVFEMVMGGQSKAFRQVVLFQYPRPCIWTIGFIAGPPHGEIQSALQDGEVQTVFLPTAPSPTNGIILFIPARDLRILKMTVDEAFKIILSGGILTSPEAADPTKGIKP
ncbi:MAG: DUF502 domain-containing protein [Micavibrio aeruginosavorus]|nr:DUF502 domain-containing protein [Micavibrio aeruginosavorus]